MCITVFTEYTDTANLFLVEIWRITFLSVEKEYANTENCNCMKVTSIKKELSWSSHYIQSWTESFFTLECHLPTSKQDSLMNHLLSGHQSLPFAFMSINKHYARGM